MEFKFLPSIETISDAQKVARMGTWAACFVTGITTVVALASIFGLLPKDLPIDGWALVDAAIFAIIAWGIHRMSRVAAVAGLVIYILEKIFALATVGTKYGSGIFITIVIIFAFINAVRGTFAYHDYKGSRDETWDDLSWTQMNDAEQTLWKTLGWDEASWGKKAAAPDSNHKYWAELTKAERDAATKLGYDQSSWDKE